MLKFLFILPFLLAHNCGSSDDIAEPIVTKANNFRKLLELPATTPIKEKIRIKTHYDTSNVKDS